MRRNEESGNPEYGCFQAVSGWFQLDSTGFNLFLILVSTQNHWDTSHLNANSHKQYSTFIKL